MRPLESTAPRASVSDVAVLLVADVQDGQSALQALLARDGLRIVTAASGPEALAALLVHDVALALVDADMPGMSGVELAEQMRGSERTRTVPIIFVTSDAADQARVFRGYESAAVDYLLKPVEPRVLGSKVDTFVELHRHRRQLSEPLAQLKEMLRLSDMFVAVLGHDLRSPLQSVELGAQLILSQPDDRVLAQRMATTMQRASRRMARLIDQLLDFARARLQGGVPILAETCDLADITQGVIAELEPAASARVELRLSGDPHGTWDRDRIAQVLRNVLGNAVQHGAQDTPILVTVAADTDQVRIEIQNRGHVPPEMLPTLFDPFTRAENGSSRANAGLGLGLYIVDQIVKAHRGSIDVESSPESGTRFRIVLPRTVASQA